MVVGQLEVRNRKESRRFAVRSTLSEAVRSLLARLSETPERVSVVRDAIPEAVRRVAFDASIDEHR
jgi:hypothetical protein